MLLNRFNYNKYFLLRQLSTAVLSYGLMPHESLTFTHTHNGKMVLTVD